LQFGGAGSYVAKDPKGRSRLEALVGPNRDKALGAITHKLQKRIPIANRWLAACLAARGETTATFARTLRFSDTTVRKWLKGRSAAHLPALFGGIMEPGFPWSSHTPVGYRRNASLSIRPQPDNPNRRILAAIRQSQK